MTDTPPVKTAPSLLHHYRSLDERIRRWIRLGLIAVVVTATLVSGTLWLMQRWSHVAINDARIAARLVTVSSEVSGQVLNVDVIGGLDVEAGQVLVTIDPQQAQLMVDGLQARLASLDAQGEQLRAEQDMARARNESRMAAGRADIAAAEANHEARLAARREAQTSFDRVEELAGRHVASAQALDSARAVLDGAQQAERATAAAVQAAQANLAVIEADAAQIGVIERQIATLQADRLALEAERAQRQIDLERRVITADFDGVIDANFIDAGEYVTPGMRLFIYHRAQEVWVDANVRETDFRKIHIGAEADITVDAFPGRHFTGHVTRLGGAATSQFALLPSPNPSGNFTKVTQRLPIRVGIDTEGALLRPGMMVELNVDVAD